MAAAGVGVWKMLQEAAPSVVRPQLWFFCVVAACKRCNHQKGHRLLGNTAIELLALPYVPNFAEYLALTNGGRILGDQMDFLRSQFSKESRLRH